MTFLSLFAGIAGFDLGFERAGLECVGQVEIDPKCQEVLAKHWPKVKRYGDIKEFDAVGFRGVDVVCGGFPCQDLSVAGKRKGLAGGRSGLFWEAHRVIAEIKPGGFALENVPGLLSGCGCLECRALGRIFDVHRKWRGRQFERSGIVVEPCAKCVAIERFLQSHSGRNMQIVLASLVELGYRVCWRVLDSQYFGVAQRRRRVFVVGSLGDGRCAEILFEPESLCGDSAPSREAGERVADGLTVGANQYSGFSGEPVIARTLMGKSNDSQDPSMETYIASPITASAGHHGHSSPRGDGSDNLVVTPINSDAERDGVATTPSPDGKGRHSLRNPGLGIGDEGDPMFTLGAAATHAIAVRTAQAGSNGWGISDSAYCLDGAQGQAVAFGWNKSQSQTVRVDDETTDALQADPSSDPAVAFTQNQREEIRDLEGVAGALPIEPGMHQQTFLSADSIVRRLTPTECARLQGFPDDWNSWLADSARYRQFGNAVTVSVAEWIGRTLLAQCS